jgi:cysteinyl-tRNA synthetase
MKLYNTLTKEKEEFKSLDKNNIGMYHCGPTVYWTQHIGNMRAVVIADLIKRSFEYLDYNVTLVRNYTDVGHLTGDNDGDADTGEDRMAKAAKRENIDPLSIAKKYIAQYESDRQSLNTLAPEYTPSATEHINEMIDMVQILLEKGFAYSTDLAIYFDVTKKEDYTKLSGQNIENQIHDAGHGSVSDANKKNPQDFSLWFFKAGAHAHALQTWESPFHSPLVSNGEGFPGWHIECSAMSKKYLGDSFDIHMGGIEHIPIHHTNEIAQSESATGKPMSTYWVHNEHLLVDGGKMSKSEGTSYTLDDIIKKGFSALDVRYFFLQAHYRSKQNFTWESLTAAQTGLNKIYREIVSLRTQVNNAVGIVHIDFKKQFIEKISDDINIPQALAVFHTMMKSDIKHEDKIATAYDFDRILGLNLKNHQEEILEIPKNIKELLQLREQARANKNWEKSDELRNNINELGYIVSDTNGQQKIEKK